MLAKQKVSAISELNFDWNTFVDFINEMPPTHECHC